MTTAIVRVASGCGPGCAVDLGRGPVIVGTSSHADVRLSDPTVSAAHLELSMEIDGVRVRDLGSSSGTWVGKLRVHDVVLTGSSTVTIGGTTLEVAVESVKVSSSEPMQSSEVDSLSKVPDSSVQLKVGFEDLVPLPYREARAAAIERFERTYVPSVLARSGTVVRAAEHAGVKRESFHRMLGRVRPASDVS